MVYDMREAVVAGDGGLRYVENAADFSPVESLATEALTEKPGSLVDSVEPGTKLIVDISLNSSVFDDFSSGVKESLSSSINQRENSVKNTLDSLSSVTSITKNASEVVDNAFNNVFSTVDQTGDIAGDKLSSFSTDLKEASNKTAFLLT